MLIMPSMVVVCSYEAGTSRSKTCGMCKVRCIGCNDKKLNT